MNKNNTINTSDSGEEIDDSVWFLKGGNVTALWSSIVNYVEVDCMCKQEHGWWNAVIMTGNRKRVALITVCTIVDTKAICVNLSKAQHERLIGRVISTKTIRNK